MCIAGQYILFSIDEVWFKPVVCCNEGTGFSDKLSRPDLLYVIDFIPLTQTLPNNKVHIFPSLQAEYCVTQ